MRTFLRRRTNFSAFNSFGGLALTVALSLDLSAAAPRGASPQGSTPSVADGLRALGSGPARLTWVLSQDANDLFVQGKTGQLYVLDTEDGKGERCLLGELTSYAKPLFTPDGRQIIYTDLEKRSVFAVNFDGTGGTRKIAEGYASDVWWDPTSTHTWVYIRQGYRDTRGKIIRVRLDDPKITEKVWQASPTGQPFISYFQLSRDGTSAMDTFPWPQVGLASVEDGDYSPLGKGCWPGMAPDDSERCFYFTGAHNEIVLFDGISKAGRPISVTTMPGLSSPNAFHPRWSNHSRIITVTAPEGKPETELYAGRFDESFTRIEKWVRITSNRQAECFGDAWFRDGVQPVKTESLFSKKRDHSKPKAGRPGLVFRWENEKATNAIGDAAGKTLRFCRATAQGQVVTTPWFGVALRNGALVADEESASAALSACAQQGAFSLAFNAQAGKESVAVPAVVAALGGSAAAPALSVEQIGPALFASVRTADGAVKRLGMGSISAMEPTHWCLVYADGLLECYRNGLMERSCSVRPDFAAWKSADFQWGRYADGSAPWKGEVDAIELFERPLPPQAVGELYTTETRHWAQRPVIPQVMVEAELVERSTPSDPAKIAPYTRALVESVWKVRKVVRGTLKEKKIVALHWCVMGGQVMETDARPGTLKTMLLEPLESHPQLEGELRAADVIEVDLPVYYEVER